MNEEPEQDQLLLLDHLVDDEWKERKRTLQSINSLTRNKTIVPRDNYESKVLASLVPDEIIYQVNDYSHRHYDACLLFGDVSGKQKKTNKQMNKKFIHRDHDQISKSI